MKTKTWKKVLAAVIAVSMIVPTPGVGTLHSHAEASQLPSDEVQETQKISMKKGEKKVLELDGDVEVSTGNKNVVSVEKTNSEKVSAAVYTHKASASTVEEAFDMENPGSISDLSENEFTFTKKEENGVTTYKVSKGDYSMILNNGGNFLGTGDNYIYIKESDGKFIFSRTETQDILQFHAANLRFDKSTNVSDDSKLLYLAKANDEGGYDMVNTIEDGASYLILYPDEANERVFLFAFTGTGDQRNTGTKMVASKKDVTSEVTLTAADCGKTTVKVGDVTYEVKVVEKFDDATLKANASSNSEHPGTSDGGAANAFDDTDNLWHSDYSGATNGIPSEDAPIYIQTGFGKQVLVDSLTYLARGIENNIIGNYTISVANMDKDEDGNIKTPTDEDFVTVWSGSFEVVSGNTVQTVQLPTLVKATHIRLTATSKIGGGSDEIATKKIEIFGSSIDAIDNYGCIHEEWTLENAKDATCTEEGYTGDMVCSNETCGETFHKGSAIAAKGHDWKIVSVEAATADTDGSAHVKCVTCEMEADWVVKAGEEVDRTKTTVTASNSQNYDDTEGYAKYAIDGNAGTYWHSLWNGIKSYNDLWLDLELDQAKLVDGYRYTSKSTVGANGNITSYIIYTKLKDTDEWTEAARGTWTDDAQTKTVTFENPAYAKYVRLKVEGANSNANDGRVYANAAEVRVLAHDVEEIVGCTHKTLTKVDKVDATCTEDGHETYWVCAAEDCGKMFKDEAGTEEFTNLDDVKIAAAHKLEKQDGKAATCTEAGQVEHWKCTAENCGKLFEDEAGTKEITDVVIPAKDHDLEEVAKVDATCTTDGKAAHYRCKAEGCGKLFTDAEGTVEVEDGDLVIPAAHTLEHVEKVNADCENNTAGTKEHYKCTAEGCGKLFSDPEGTTEVTVENLVIKAEHVLVKVDAKEAACEETGLTEHYKCEACGKLYADAEGTTETTLDAVTVAAKGHAWGDWTTKEDDATKEVRECGTCEKTEERTVSNPVISHDVMKATTGSAQEGFEEAYGEGPASYAIDDNANTKWHTEYTGVSSYDDLWLQVEFTDSAYLVSGFKYLPRQTQTNGIISKYQILTSLDGENWTVAASGDWTVDATEKVVTFEPVKARYVRLKADEAASDQLEAGNVFACAAEINVTGKAYACEHTGKETKVVGVKAATCTTDGYTGDTICTDCGGVVTKGATIAAAHSYGDLVAQKDATCTEAGMKAHYQCAECKAYFAEDKTATTEKALSIPAKGHNWSEWEVVEDATAEKEGTKKRHCLTDGCTAEETASIDKLISFPDVQDSKAFYYSPVYWAAKNGVTSGRVDGTFDPKGDVTRAEMVTFLYRLAGKPDVTGKKHSFKDVASDKFYNDAVVWASENGIVKGTSATTFEPNKTVTRGEVVTFLWRYAGQPTITSVKGFADVKPDKFFYQAVRWAAANDVTTGDTSGNFAPYDNCNRGAAVTFIYRTNNLMK